MKNTKLNALLKRLNADGTKETAATLEEYIKAAENVTPAEREVIVKAFYYGAIQGALETMTHGKEGAAKCVTDKASEIIKGKANLEQL